MTWLTPYLALSVLPVAFLFGYSFNPVEFTWAYRHGHQSMPEEVRERAATLRRYASFLGDGLILGLIAVLARKNGISSAGIGLGLDNLGVNSAVGLAAGLGLVLVQALVAKFLSVDPKHPFTFSVRKGPASAWILIFALSSFSEELWVAFSLVTLRQTGHSFYVAAAITASIIGLVHYGYGFGGAVASAAKGAISAALFWHYGSVLLTFVYHFIGNLGSFYWNRFGGTEQS